MKHREQDLQREILRLLNLYGKATKIHNTGIFDPRRKLFRTNQNKGVSDILACVKDKKTGLGIFIACEVKSKNGKLTPEQGRFLDEIKANGGIAFVARSVDDVMEVLKKLGVKKI